MTTHVFLKLYKFCLIVFYFPEVSFSFHRIDLRIFSAHILSCWISRGIQKEELLNFLKHKHTEESQVFYVCEIKKLLMKVQIIK